MKRAFEFFVLAVLLLSVNVFAAEKKKDTKQNDEEALRQDAKTLMQNSVQTKREPVSGKFMLDKEESASDKPLPKLVGYVNQGGSLIPIMVMNQSMLNMLIQQDQKEVHVFGVYLDKGDKGKYLLLDDISVSAGGGAPQMKRKRGGL
jgi:hypothetical protein